MPAIGFGKPAKKPGNRFSSDPKIRAREMVEAGILGQSQPGAGRPRKKHSDSQKKKRASTVIAEAVRENADKIAAVIPDVVNDPDASRYMKLRAARLGVDIEQRETERAREDEREGRMRERLDALPEDREAIAESLAKRLAANPILVAELGAVLSRAGELAGIPPKSS